MRYIVCPCCENLIALTDDFLDTEGVVSNIEKITEEDFGIMFGSDEKGGEDNR